MEDKIYRDEYVREQARIAARREAEPHKGKKNNRLRLVGPALVVGLLAYTGVVLGDVGIVNLQAFLELDFLIAALALVGIFLWGRYG